MSTSSNWKCVLDFRNFISRIDLCEEHQKGETFKTAFSFTLILTKLNTDFFHLIYISQWQWTCNTLCDFRLPPRSRWELHSCGLLRSEMEPISCPEISVGNYQSLLCNNNEQCSSHVMHSLAHSYVDDHAMLWNWWKVGGGCWMEEIKEVVKSCTLYIFFKWNLKYSFGRPINAKRCAFILKIIYFQ